MHREQSPQGVVLQCGDHTKTFKRRALARLETWQEPGDHVHGCVHSSSDNQELTVMLKGLWDPTQHGWLAGDYTEGKFRPSFLRERHKLGLGAQELNA